MARKNRKQKEGRWEKWFIVSDVHAPFHDDELVDKLCECMLKEKPDGLMLNGDFLDLFTLASFNADSVGMLKKWDLDREYEVAKEVLDRMDQSVGDAKKIYLYGNHEDRYSREVNRGDRAKYGKSLVSPEVGLGLRQRGYRVYDNWKQDVIRLGNHLEVTHGLWTPVHVAKKHLDEFQGSIIVGHSHRFQSFVNGKRGAWNFGFLGELGNEGFYYMPRAQREKWSNSFGTVEIDPKGGHHVQPVQIYDKSFICNGVRY